MDRYICIYTTSMSVLGTFKGRGERRDEKSYSFYPYPIPSLGPTRQSQNPRQSLNPKFNYSTYIGGYLNNSFIKTIQRLSNPFLLSIHINLHSSYQSTSICTFSFCNISVTLVHNVFPRLPHDPSPSFPPIPTDLEPYVAHSLHIKYLRSGAPC